MTGRWTPRAERWALVLATAAFLFLVFFRGGVFVYTLLDRGDGGIWVDEADRVLSGEVLYRDVFEFVGPGIVYLNAAALAMMGARIEAVGVLAVALGVALVAAMHSVAGVLLPARWRLGPPVVLAVLLYAAYGLGNHKWPSLLCGLLALRVAMRPPPLAWAEHAAAGVLLGAATLFTQDLGGALTAGVCVHLLLSATPRAALVVAAGWTLAVAAGLAPFAAAAGPSLVLYDVFVFPLERYRGAHRAAFAWPGLGPRTLAQMLLVTGGLAAAVATLARARTPPPLRLCAVAGLAALAPTLLRGSDPARLALFAAVLVPVLFAALHHMTRAGAWTRGVAAAALALLAVAVAWGSLGLAVQRQLIAPMTREQHRAGPVWVEQPMPEVSWLESRTRAGEAAFVLPARGGIAFLTRTRNPTRFPYLGRTDLHGAEHLREAVDELMAARPRHGLWERHAPSPALAPVWGTLRAFYDAERAPNGTWLLTLREPPSAASTRAATTP
jgi:hypothetical protein